MKRVICAFAFIFCAATLSAQSLDRMQRFNEPDSWAIEGNTLTMDVTPQSDYWRISHYGFKATFEEFSIKHLPDQRRLEWLEKNKSN